MHTDSSPKGDLTKLQRGLMTEADARAMLERIRWPNGLACIYCGNMEVGRIEAQGKTYTRPDGSERTVPARHLFKCKACKKQFSVTKGTIFEDSKIPLQVWITVMYRMCSSKKGISAHQIHREYGVGYETAWFMCHRIRWAMTDKNPTPLTGVIEADETYVGGKVRGHREHRIKKLTMSDAVKAGFDKKTQVFGMLERGGRVRAQALPSTGKRISQRDVQATVRANVDVAKSQLITDEHDYYFGISNTLPHDVIRHKSEYVRGIVHTQGIEGFWAGLKRQLVGTHHHVDAGYLNMYVQEQAFRYTARKISDAERWSSLMSQVDGRVDWYVGKNAKGDS
jgi:transposase-like protein